MTDTLTKVYQESNLRFGKENALAGANIARLQRTFVSTQISVLPGFAPAGEASFGRAQDRLFVSAKGPKTIDAPAGRI